MKNRDCTNRMTSTDMSNRARIYRLLVTADKVLYYVEVKSSICMTLKLPCEILFGPQEISKGPYLRNEKSYQRSAGPKILVSSRAFTHSFMKVTSRHSFTLFQPLFRKKLLFRGVHGLTICHKMVQNMPPGPLSM